MVFDGQLWSFCFTARFPEGVSQKQNYRLPRPQSVELRPVCFTDCLLGGLYIRDTITEGFGGLGASSIRTGFWRYIASVHGWDPFASTLSIEKGSRKRKLLD